MPEYEAEVMPDQPWNENGTANVTPKPPFPTTQTKALPLVNHSGGDLTVQRSEYPDGLVVIPADSPPASEPATLPLRSSSGGEIILKNTIHIDWPDGVVTWFTGY